MTRNKEDRKKKTKKTERKKKKIKYSLENIDNEDENDNKLEKCQKKVINDESESESEKIISKKKKKKKKKERKRKKESSSSSSSDDDDEQKEKKKKKKRQKKEVEEEEEEEAEEMITSSLDCPPTDEDDGKEGSPECRGGGEKKKGKEEGISLLLFYQYVEPPWDNQAFQTALDYCHQSATHYHLTGRMRVAKEGLNCTLTGTWDNIRAWCEDLRSFGPNHEFRNTEFKITDHLPQGQAFAKLHAFPVEELVHYGLAGSKAPTLHNTGLHLEPQQYHDALAKQDTVVIDVRNVYETAIGRFDPPKGGAKWIDPKMRKSTEFPHWLQRKETQEQLRDKRVLMYCTGGVRCERASALLKHQMETDDHVKSLGIRGVYQLQGGIDKYFKAFPQGGYWAGKNYVFDKRFAHAPPMIEASQRQQQQKEQYNSNNKEGIIEDQDDTMENDDKKDLSKTTSEQQQPISTTTTPNIMGKCESCCKPWDMYRGKHRCYTCGVPVLICRTCLNGSIIGEKKHKKKKIKVKCRLCTEQGIQSKSQIRERERREQLELSSSYGGDVINAHNENNSSSPDSTEEASFSLKGKKAMKQNGSNVVSPFQKHHKNKNNNNNNDDSDKAPTTRLFLKNMCSKSMDESTLLSFLPGITHIQWLHDRTTGRFYGSAFVEMATLDDAAKAIAKNGKRILKRPIRIKYQKANEKDVWPPPNTAIMVE